MVVFSSFMIHVIVDGITYSFGVLFIALLEDFQGGKGNTAWILSIFVGMTLGSGKLIKNKIHVYHRFRSRLNKPKQGPEKGLKISISAME